MSARTPGVDRFGTARRVGHGRRAMAMALGLMSCAVCCRVWFVYCFLSCCWGPLRELLCCLVTL